MLYQMNLDVVLLVILWMIQVSLLELVFHVNVYYAYSFLLIHFLVLEEIDLLIIHI